MGQRRQHDSYLFHIRLWMEDLGDGQAEWRGQLHHVTSRETRYFRDWPTLVALIQALLPAAEAAPMREYTPESPDDL
jgi:hypothetical protein